MMQAESILFLITLALYAIVMALFFLFIAVKKQAIAAAATRLGLIALAVHTAAIVLRGVAMGRLPMANQYEFATAFAWALCLVSLIFIHKFRFPVLGAFASPVTLLLGLYAGQQKLNELTGAPVPAPLASLRGKKSRFFDVTDKEGMQAVVLGALGIDK